MAAAAARGAVARGAAVIVYEVERVWSDNMPTHRRESAPKSSELNAATEVIQRTPFPSVIKRSRRATLLLLLCWPSGARGLLHHNHLTCTQTLA